MYILLKCCIGSMQFQSKFQCVCVTYKLTLNHTQNAEDPSSPSAETASCLPRCVIPIPRALRLGSWHSQATATNSWHLKRLPGVHGACLSPHWQSYSHSGLIKGGHQERGWGHHSRRDWPAQLCTGQREDGRPVPSFPCCDLPFSQAH